MWAGLRVLDFVIAEEVGPEGYDDDDGDDSASADGSESVDEDLHHRHPLTTCFTMSTWRLHPHG